MFVDESRPSDPFGPDVILVFPARLSNVRIPVSRQDVFEDLEVEQQAENP